jgi:GNAT superfamily N-acetyltransferase
VVIPYYSQDEYGMDETEPIMTIPLTIRPLQTEDIQPIAAAFAAIGWHGKTAAQYERYLAEQEAGKRITLVSFQNGEFRGYVNVEWASGYTPFGEAGIPEITDFNVLPAHQRQGIGAQLMDEAERLAGERSPVVGIGVGMSAAYGAAQRLYVQRGYIPDGRGLTYDGRFLTEGETTRLDDSLVLYFTRRLREPDSAS